MEKTRMKEVIYICIKNILIREQKKYAKLNEIYNEVSSYLEVENNNTLKSQIRGRLQECCEQYSSFTGDALFLTEKIRSGNWTIKEKNKKYIRHVNNTYLITDDNWENAVSCKEVPVGSILEENLDVIYKVKLIDLIGKNRANIIINELNNIRTLLKRIKLINDINDGYGLAFEVFSVSVIHNIDYEECINKYIIHGDNDGKIDAIYYGEEYNIYVYQIKTNNISDNIYSEMKSNYDDCELGIQPKNGKELYDFIKSNKAYLNDKKINLRSVSTNSKRKTNYKPKEIYDKFFKNKLLPPNTNGLSLIIPKPRIINEEGIKDQYNISTDGQNNFTFYINAKDLISHLLEALGINTNEYNKDSIDISKYFSDNVRGVLSVNKRMVYTIENEPENFIKYNNGISITGEVSDQGNKIKIVNPVINNGQQTITTLIKINKNLNKINIPVKITNETNIIVKGNISRYSNEQVKVKSIDMLSLNPFIRQIQSIIFETEYNKENYFLEIYSSGKKSYYEIIKKMYKSNNIIDLLDFIKLYFSVENNKDLGLWKNSPNMQVDKTEINNFIDVNKSFKVCESIAKYENFICSVTNKKEKDDFKSADLAFKYLMCKENLTEEEAAYIIKSINQKYYYDIADEKSKLIDIYKSSTIITKIEEELKLYRNKKIKVTS